MYTKYVIYAIYTKYINIMYTVYRYSAMFYVYKEVDKVYSVCIKK